MHPLAAAVAAALTLHACRAVQITLPAHDEECFFEQVDQGNKITGSFEVIHGGNWDVDATIFGPNGEAHYSVHRQRQGHFTVIAPGAGLYRLCFRNKASSLYPKLIAFSLHTGDDLYRDIAKQEHISPLETEITRLQDAIALIEDEQEYMYAREKSSKEMNESTNKRVLWFSLGEVAALLVMGAWQIYHLRAFFERKRQF